MRRLKINPKVAIGIAIVIIIILIIAYSIIINKYLKGNKFSDNIIEISRKNENNIFSIDSIYLFSSANVVDNSIEKNLQDLSIYQYADISIYIKNNNYTDEMSNQNTVKKLYIDNISLEGNSEVGEKYLYYTNSLNIGQNTDIQNAVNTDKIDFNIIYTNEEDKNTDYSNPTFYTDCSNPITLKYVNKNIMTGYKIDDDSSVSFNGKLLEKAGVPIDNLKCKIQFRVNLINNNDEYYSCWVNFDIPLDNLYSEGKTTKSAKNISGTKYEFFMHTS